MASSQGKPQVNFSVCIRTKDTTDGVQDEVHFKALPTTKFTSVGDALAKKLGLTEDETKRRRLYLGPGEEIIHRHQTVGDAGVKEGSQLLYARIVDEEGEDAVSTEAARLPRFFHSDQALQARTANQHNRMRAGVGSSGPNGCSVVCSGNSAGSCMVQLCRSVSWTSANIVVTFRGAGAHTQYAPVLSHSREDEGGSCCFSPSAPSRTHGVAG